jgi:histidinol-phosphatase (PHP family)
MIYRTDYHIHTTFSDGKALPDDYIPAAMEAGLSEIGFSEHLNLFSPDLTWCMDPQRIDEYTGYIAALKKRNSSIQIRTGLEIDYFPGREKELSEFLDGIKLDYRIGSVHYQGERTVDLGPEFYEGKDIDSLYEAYFETVIKAANSGLFDIIGHCDLIRIYCYRPTTDPAPLYRKLARAMRKNNVAFEVNTNGRNKPLQEFYPDPAFLHVFKSENVPVCVNSDAHMPSRAGQFFDEAYSLLRKAGFCEMAGFCERKRKFSVF